MSFPSKILLIGEHTVLFGSQALSIPFKTYSGDWIFKKTRDDRLIDLANKLDGSIINTSLFREDCEKGLSFKSTIPQQFGLGSSGALTAAIYKAYAFELQTDNTLLQKELAKIESIFHGQSSGTDAMVSFLDSSIHSVNNTTHILEQNPIQTLSCHVYLYNSSIRRSAKTYINQFKTLVDSEVFEIKNLCGLVDNIIDRILGNNNSDIWERLGELSKFQYNILSSFIPNTVKAIWEEGLTSGSYYFKLCGAGGGGYFLVFSKNEMLDLFPEELTCLKSNQ